MAVIVTNKFGFDEIKRKLSKGNVVASEKKIQRMLSYIGEHLCGHARTITKGHSSGGYDDHTGNLRSSIGFRVYKDGKIVQDGGFKNVSGGSGISEAKKALNQYGLTHEIPINGWTLVIVAGMSYAMYVEAKGFNVLHLTKEEMRKKIEELKVDLKML